MIQMNFVFTKQRLTDIENKLMVTKKKEGRDKLMRLRLQIHTVKCWLLSGVRLFATPWTVAHQAPLSMEFSRHKYWSGLPFPRPGYLPHPGTEPRSPALQADSLQSEPPRNTHYYI